jgi:hypothetical protein
MLPLELVWRGGPNASLVAATFGFCLLGTLCFGLGPALKLSRATALEDLKTQGGEDVVRRRWRFLPRNPLVVVQFALSLALITAAALFVRGALASANADIGLKVDRTFIVEVDGSLGGYDRTQTQQLYRTLEERLAAIPGVQAAGVSATVPFGMVSLGKSVQRAGTVAAPDAKPATAADGLAFGASWNSVGADYFKAVGLPLLRGRAFNAAEATQPGAPAVAIIDEPLAKKLWPEGDAVGQRLQFSPSGLPSPPTTALAG